MNFKKAIFLLMILTICSQSKNNVYDLSESSRIKNLQKIDYKIKEISLNINEDNYIYDFKRYISDNNLTMIKEESLKREVRDLNKDFIYNERVFKYRKFLKNISYRLPEEKRMKLIKKIVLEEADYILFKDIFINRIVKSCQKSKKAYKKEKDKFIKLGAHISSFKPKAKICFYDKLTFNGKKEYRDTLERKTFKYLFLQKLYLNRNNTIESIQKKLDFYMSKKYQDFYPLRVEITNNLLNTLTKEDSNISSVISPSDIVNEIEKEIDLAIKKDSKKINRNNEIDFLDN